MSGFEDEKVAVDIFAGDTLADRYHTLPVLSLVGTIDAWYLPPEVRRLWIG